MFSNLVRRYYAQRNVPGTLTIYVTDQNDQRVDLTNATEIRVCLAHEGDEWGDFTNFTQYRSVGASSRVITGSASQGEVLFTHDNTVFTKKGQYRLSTMVIDASHPSGSLYPEYAWDKATVFDEYGKDIQQLIEKLRTNLSMWSMRYETVMAGTNNFTDIELYTFLQQGLEMFNGWPPNTTTYTLSNYPAPIEGPFFLCSLVWAIVGLELHEIAQHFQYNDNGISFMRDKSGRYASVLGQIFTLLNQQMPNLKKIIALDALSVKGQFSGMTSMPRSLDRALRGTRFWR